MRTRKTKAAELGPRAVARIVETVLEQEKRQAAISVTFVGPARIRTLNARWKGKDRPTDVLAFALVQPDGSLVGDVYICPAVAAKQAAQFGVSRREELRRLVIHGTLHVLGYDHPEGPNRTRSAMWRKQERYLACLG